MTIDSLLKWVHCYVSIPDTLPSEDDDILLNPRFAQFSRQLDQKILTDVVLVANDGQEIEAHKLVLAGNVSSVHMKSKKLDLTIFKCKTSRRF
jgi:hypothetical protein